MTQKPNLLFLMCDQLQGRVFDPDHVCITPNLDRLAARGLRFSRAYTPNAVCSPARASLMTGLHVHNHGVLVVTHTADDDQFNLRTEHAHWAQHLQANGYHTAYFGKWHVERSGDLEQFGWNVNGSDLGGSFAQRRQAAHGPQGLQHTFSMKKIYDTPPGYNKTLFYGVTDVPPEQRNMGIITQMALEFLDDAADQAEPWCCFVSLPEPHDPFVAGEQAFAMYDVETVPLAPNINDTLEGRPGIYRRVAQIWQAMTSREKRQAATCYYASITEIDAQFGRILDKLEADGHLDNTVVVLTADHGELLGAHGLYCKNFSAYEEIYNVPLIMAGPGIPQGKVTEARVGTHYLGPTLLELTGSALLDVADSRSFVPLLHDLEGETSNFNTGYAEYFGSRYLITQRVIWNGPWKYVHNGFDFDELYNLEEDPYELRNRAEDPVCADIVRDMLLLMWRFIRDTGDRSLLNTHYPILRLNPYGPNLLE